MTDIDKKPLALVTGASRGIGAATAKALAAKGYHVLLTARTDGGLEEVDDDIHAAGGTATLAPFDLSDFEAIDRLAQAVAGRWERLDALVMNAAMLGDMTPLSHVDADAFEALFKLNVTANFRLLKAFDPLLRAAPHADVIALTSSVANEPRAFWGPYAASKAALANLTETYGAEMDGLADVKVHVVDPKGTATSMRASAFPGEDPSTLRTPEDVASEILALLRISG
ncbi:SDR family NAD(P)-dependent oxidoreductase [Pacificimonas sp. WHA3]|uniref:SDR family NAD(P)-dependent oxidoreductase n=1 Tax=Pacificimonas pallii TaxID=2827236 RepID=A0ABS6SEJ8_9SPHN|nr:SDR family NAD(P)-dependent oxidoreductase [Pacificimonas pallii]MBV7256828.1 SDR family NAD(P)-dependent oxidoreductase [Pacificimonas pallii]